MQWIPGVKLTWRESDTPSAEVKNGGAIPSNVFVAWCVIN
jgi:hypothetical protein